MEVAFGGLLGDRATQPYHGGPDAAICVHLEDHYSFWRKQYGLELPFGAVGENLTVSGLGEQSVQVGDTVRIGSVLAQVSGPRVPCANQARRIGRADWVRLTLRENRTGFYMRVLRPGTLQAGDPWELEERVHTGASITAVNRCMYLAFDPPFATRMLTMSGLGEWWKSQAAERLKTGNGHWTATLANEAS